MKKICVTIILIACMTVFIIKKLRSKNRRRKKQEIFLKSNPSKVLDREYMEEKEAKENIFLKIQMYIISLWLLFLLIIPITFKYPDMNGTIKENVMALLNDNLLPTISVIMVIIGIMMLKQLEYRWKGTRDLPIRITGVESENFEYLTFLTTYIIPLVCINLDEKRYVIVLFVLLVIIGVIFIKSDFYLGNPTMALMNYRLYKIQYIDNDILEERLVITKEKLQPGDYVEAIPFDQKTWFVKRSAKE